MPVLPIAIALVTVLSALAVLHIAWALGSQRGFTAAIPEIDGEPAFRPGRGMTLAVAALLLVAAALCAWQGGLLGFIPSRLSTVGAWMLAMLFAVRAVGDFRLVGFFKRVQGTRFARMDTRVYSPLCAVIAVLAGFLAVSGS